MIEGHGDDLYKYKRTIDINFSSNVYNSIDLQGLKEHLISKLSSISSYPEPCAFSLESLIAQKSLCDTSNVLVTNGATEAIYLIAQTFAKANSIIVSPTFSEYSDACSLHDHNISYILPPHSCKLPNNLNGAKRCFWICNPNNPTGETFNAEQLKNLFNSNLDTIFILDESYEYFTTKKTISIEEGLKYNNLIILHSLTKRFAIPGLRLGYITACSKLISLVRDCKMPWSVNSLAIEAGSYLLSEQTNVLKDKLDIPLLLVEAERVAGKLQSMKSFVVRPSDTHYMLVEIVSNLNYGYIKSKKARVLKDYLAEQHGILIRDASNFKTLGPNFFRIAVQTPKENNVFLNILEKLL